VESGRILGQGCWSGGIRELHPRVRVELTRVKFWNAPHPLHQPHL